MIPFNNFPHLALEEWVELNFIIEKFKGLPPAMQRLIHDCLTSGDSKMRSTAIVALTQFLICCDQGDLLKFARNILRMPRLVNWSVSKDLPRLMARSAMVERHFKSHPGEQGIEVEPVPLAD
jgi:hypothetical protein